MSISDMKKNVVDHIYAMKEHAAEVLMELVRRPSVFGNEMGAVSFMKGTLDAAGLASEIIPLNESIKSHPEYTNYTEEPVWNGRGNLVCDYGGNGKGRSMILNAHLDVVPGGTWTEAFEPMRDDNIITGRGSSDDKGGAVAAYLAMKALADRKIPLSGRLSMHNVIDEETGGNGTLSLLCDGYTADAAIVTECTDNVICPSGCGALWFQLTTTGTSTHTIDVDEGISALDKANQAISLLKDYEKYLVDHCADHPYYRDLDHNPNQLCISMIQAGVEPCMMPECCNVEGGVEFVPYKDIEEIKKEMRQWLLDKSGPWLRDHFELRFDKLHNAAYEIPPDDSFVTCIQSVVRDLGLPDELKGRVSSCDSRLYPRVAHMPVITLGPGMTKNIHTSHEKIRLSRLLKAAAIYACTAIDWCGVTEK